MVYRGATFLHQGQCHSFSIGIMDTIMIAGGPETGVVCYIPWFFFQEVPEILMQFQRTGQTMEWNIFSNGRMDPWHQERYSRQHIFHIIMVSDGRKMDHWHYYRFWWQMESHRLMWSHVSPVITDIITAQGSWSYNSVSCHNVSLTSKYHRNVNST